MKSAYKRGRIFFCWFECCNYKSRLQAVTVDNPGAVRSFGFIFYFLTYFILFIYMCVRVCINKSLAWFFSFAFLLLGFWIDTEKYHCLIKLERKSSLYFVRIYCSCMLNEMIIKKNQCFASICICMILLSLPKRCLIMAANDTKHFLDSLFGLCAVSTLESLYFLKRFRDERK